MIKRAPLPDGELLSFRKLTVVLFLQAGHGFVEAAAAIGISESMVRLHVNQIAAKLPPSRLKPKEHVLLYADRLIARQPDLAAEIIASFMRSHDPPVAGDS